MKLPYLLLSIVAIATVSRTTITADTSSTAQVKEGVPGGKLVETTKIRATVTGIDAAKRKLTLVTPDSKKVIVKAGPEVVNFDQIKIGDQLKATLTEETVVRMAKPGEKLEDEYTYEVEVAPEGAKPGLMMADTVQATATVTKIDMKKRKATLQFSDGSTKKVSVRKDVDLSKRKVGEKVVIRTTEVFAILLEKP